MIIACTKIIFDHIHADFESLIKNWMDVKIILNNIDNNMNINEMYIEVKIA